MYKDLTGEKYGLLTVIGRTADKISPCGTKVVQWECRCDCGGTNIVNTNSLLHGKIKSCGCLQRKAAVEANTKHGLYQSRIYRIFYGMHQRCENPKSPSFKKYGGKGIKVCPEWNRKDGFENFYKWSMEHGYQESLSIDRIDYTGDYEPENCRWADSLTQMNNFSRNVNITWNGETHSLSVWGRMKPNGLDYEALRARLRDGWPVEKAFAESKHERKLDSEGRMITANGETHNVKTWCKITGIYTTTFYRRLGYGWDEVRAATEPPRRKREN